MVYIIIADRPGKDAIECEKDARDHEDAWRTVTEYMRRYGAENVTFWRIE